MRLGLNWFEIRNKTCYIPEVKKSMLKNDVYANVLESKLSLLEYFIFAFLHFNTIEIQFHRVSNGVSPMFWSIKDTIACQK